MPIVEINPEPVLKEYTPYVFAKSSSEILPDLTNILFSSNTTWMNIFYIEYIDYIVDFVDVVVGDIVIVQGQADYFALIEIQPHNFHKIDNPLESIHHNWNRTSNLMISW